MAEPKNVYETPAMVCGDCPKCGKHVTSNDKFCPECGKHLSWKKFCWWMR